MFLLLASAPMTGKLCTWHWQASQREATDAFETDPINNQFEYIVKFERDVLNSPLKTLCYNYK